MSLATEPIVKISIAWPSGTVVYSDKTDGGEKGAILSFDVVVLQGAIGDVASIGSVNVTLDDTDGTLKTIYDTQVIEGTICTITQVFTGGVAKTRSLLVGKICADIVWSEGQRTLSFGIESIYSDNQIGYAPKDGDYAWLHPDAIGIPWPICFGSVLRVPAIRALKPYTLKLAEDVKFMNPSPFHIVGGEFLPQAPTVIDIAIGEVLFRGTITDDAFTPTIWNMPKYTGVECAARPSSDEDVNNPSVFWIVSGEQLIRHYCIIAVSGGDTVNRVVHQEGNKCWCEKPWDGNLLVDDDYVLIEVARYPRTAWPETMVFEANEETMLTIHKDGWTLQKDADVYYKPISTMTDRYICNLVPSTSVVEVYAHRTFYGKKIFCEVPSSYYTLHLDETLGTRRVTSITMEQPLSSRFCEGWDDDLYVSLVSTIATPSWPSDAGGNTSKIIEWILSNYTTLVIDHTSFNAVAAAIADYPSNFVIFDQPNAIEVCKEIAWQARCALVISGNTAYLKYLPQIFSGSVVETLTNALTEYKTIELGLLATEDVITKIKATWLREYSGEKIGVDKKKPERILEKELNVSTYGLHELDKNYFIYNIGQNVEASVDFWLHRLADVWKTISCNAFIDINDVLVFDYVKFNETTLNFPSGGAIGQITYIGHNTGEPIVELKATLAIKAGTVVNNTVDFCYIPPAGGSTEDVLDNLATHDYTIASDNACPSWVDILPSPSPKYRFVFTEVPKQLMRNIPFVMAAEIWDEDNNLITAIDPAFAILEVHTSDRMVHAMPLHIDMTFIGGKWDNVDAPIIITGGDKAASSHLWILSLDSRIASSRKRIGTD